MVKGEGPMRVYFLAKDNIHHENFALRIRKKEEDEDNNNTLTLSRARQRKRLSLPRIYFLKMIWLSTGIIFLSPLCFVLKVVLEFILD